MGTSPGTDELKAHTWGADICLGSGRRVAAGRGLWALRAEEAAGASSSAPGRGEALRGGGVCRSLDSWDPGLPWPPHQTLRLEGVSQCSVLVTSSVAFLPQFQLKMSSPRGAKNRNLEAFLTTAPPHTPSPVHPNFTVQIE